MPTALLHDEALLPPSVRAALWRGHQMGHARAATCSTGFAELDAHLPDGGWPLAGLTEVLADPPGSGELSLLMPALARQAHGEMVWVAPPYVPFAPALQQMGLRLDRFTWLAPQDPADAAWAVEQVLRSGTCTWVQWWGDRLMPEVLRRLHLAALDHHCPLMLLRPRAAHQHASPAPLRLACTALPQRQLGISILKRRGPALARPLTLALPDPVPAPQRRLHAGRPAVRPHSSPAPADADAVAGLPPAPLAA